jgi:hypothetical protein
MMPYGTAAEAEAALGRSMTWAEALWFRYSAGMPDLWLMWHVALVYLVVDLLSPLPAMIVQQLAPGYALRHKLQLGVAQPSLVSSYLHYIRENSHVTLGILGPFPLVYSLSFKVSLHACLSSRYLYLIHVWLAIFLICYIYRHGNCQHDLRTNCLLK